MSSEQEEFQRLSDQYVYLQGLLKALSDQERVVSAYLQEAEAASQALGAIAGEFLAPVGSGVFVHASLVSRMVFVSLGQGIFAERPVKEAMAYVEKRKQELRETVEKTQLSEGQTLSAMRSMEPRIGQLAKKLGLA